MVYGGVVDALIEIQAAEDQVEDVEAWGEDDGTSGSSDSSDGGGSDLDDAEDDGDDGDAAYTDEDEAPGGRRSKGKTARLTAKGKRPGPKGRFQGPQRALLEQLVPKYDAVPKGKRGKNPDLKAFWKQAEDLFWQSFTVDEARASMPRCSTRTKDKVIYEKTNRVCTLTLYRLPLLIPW